MILCRYTSCAYNMLYDSKSNNLLVVVELRTHNLVRTCMHLCIIFVCVRLMLYFIHLYYERPTILVLLCYIRFVGNYDIFDLHARKLYKCILQCIIHMICDKITTRKVRIRSVHTLAANSQWRTMPARYLGIFPMDRDVYSE